MQFHGAKPVVLFLPLLLLGCAASRADVAARCATGATDIRACMHAAGYIYVRDRPGCDGATRNAACYDVPNQERTWRILGTHLQDP